MCATVTVTCSSESDSDSVSDHSLRRLSAQCHVCNDGIQVNGIENDSVTVTVA
jgi:hypothetical protein